MELKVLQDFELYAKVPEETIKKYTGKIPEQFIEIWKSYGFGSFLNGFLKLINPDDYSDFVKKSYFEKNCIPLLITALGDIIVWEENAYFFIIQYRYNNFSALARGYRVFAKLLEETGYFYEKANLKNIKEALNMLGTVSYDECYGYVPLLSLGGAEKPENLRKVKLREHLGLMYQVQGEI